MVDGRQVALGTIVGADGEILTKSSELGTGAITCVLADGSSHDARRAGAHDATDLALLKIDATGLTAVVFDPGVPDTGTVLCCAGPESTPMSFGVVSLPLHEPRARRGRRDGAPPGELGIVFRGNESEPRVFLVRPGSAAARAGIQAGDVVETLGEVATVRRRP